MADDDDDLRGCLHCHTSISIIDSEKRQEIIILSDPLMGARRIFFPGVGKLGVSGRKSPSGVQGWSPSEGVWG